MAKMNRRDFFRVVGVTGTAGLVACDPKAPAEQIYPYVVQPENITPGIPTYYASVVDGSNGKESVYVKTIEGRPIYIEANPNLPASSVSPGGAASLQDTYDPDRAQAPTIAGKPASWLSSVILRMLRQASSAGLRTTALPAASAGPRGRPNC